MAYDVTEERLKVKGSEQITRDLKVNRDAFINGKAETGSIDDKGDLKVAGEILAGDDVTISGDLYVNGTEYINDSETAQTTDNYLVLRHNQTTPLGTDEYSGVAVHNYISGKTATITTDKDGTWRVADNTETDTDYTNISYYNGTYYTGLTRTAATVISGMKTAFDEDELDESVYYNNSYYHFDGSHWFPVSLVDNKLTLGSAVTDSTTITALNALTKEDLVYFRTLTITVINPVENQPVLTRAEASDLTGGQALTWDATNEKAVGKTIDTTVTSGSSSLITSGAVKTAIDNAVGALDVASVGGDGKYISAISETNGKISATATTMDTAPTASSTKAVTSGGVKTAIDNEATARNTAITNAINALDVTDTAVSGKYVSAVSETNGKISVTRADLPNRVNNAYSINGQVSCDTAAATAAKTVNLPGFSLIKGAKLIVKVSYTNTAASALTLNVNNTGAKTIRVNGVTTSSTSHTLSAGLYNCYYDGTYWSMESSYEGDSARLANFAYEADDTRSTAYCSTAAGTAAKVASMRGYALQAGTAFPINFGYGNTAASALTLNINSKGAKPIYINGSASSSSNHTLPAGTYLCRYNGTNYYIDTGYAVTDARNASQADKGKNGSTYSAFGSNAFNSTTFATSTDITNAINALDVTDSAVSNKYVSAVSETNGKITVTRANFPTDIDISLKMNMANPTGTGSFSLNRKAGTTIGEYSFAEGYNTTASGNRAHAEGSSSQATDYASHAEGVGCEARGYASHAEGYVTKASADGAHAEGVESEALSDYSHAEGHYTIANGPSQHVQGKYNVKDVNNTWAFVIGGGTSDSARKNILAFDWSGNLHIFGDIYVHCNADGTGGTKK